MWHLPATSTTATFSDHYENIVNHKERVATKAALLAIMMQSFPLLNLGKYQSPTASGYYHNPKNEYILVSVEMNCIAKITKILRSPQPQKRLYSPIEVYNL